VIVINKKLKKKFYQKLTNKTALLGTGHSERRVRTNSSKREHRFYVQRGITRWSPPHGSKLGNGTREHHFYPTYFQVPFLHVLKRTLSRRTSSNVLSSTVPNKLSLSHARARVCSLVMQIGHRPTSLVLVPTPLYFLSVLVLERTPSLS
jgi:hypothetical protein